MDGIISLLLSEKHETFKTRAIPTHVLRLPATFVRLDTKPSSSLHRYPKKTEHPEKANDRSPTSYGRASLNTGTHLPVVLLSRNQL